MNNYMDYGFETFDANGKSINLTMKMKATLTAKQRKEKLNKIEKARLDFLIKNADGLKPVTALDIARLTGMEDEYREQLLQEELKRNYDEIMKKI